MSGDLKARVLEAFCQKSKGDKKMFYIRDVTKWFPDEDRHAIQMSSRNSSMRTP